MAQINKALYNDISQAYASIRDSLDTVAVDSRAALDSIVDVDTETYPDPSANADAALQIELVLLDSFNSAYRSALIIEENISIILNAVRVVNDFVITQSGFDGNSKEKLDNWINIGMTGYWSTFDDGSPLGWANLSSDAGYDTTDWDIGVITNWVDIDLVAITKSFYKMNDSAGTTDVVDSQGFSNGDLNVNTDTKDIAVGQINGALEFDGAADNIDCNDPFNSVFGDGFSVNLWSKPTDGQPGTGGYKFMGVTDGGGNNLFNMGISGANYVFNYRAGAGTSVSYNTTSGFANGAEDWHMVTLTVEKVDSNNIRARWYFDGTLVGTSGLLSVVDMTFYSVATNLFIGNNGAAAPATFYNGELDAVSMHLEVLSQTEIDFLYNGGTGTESLAGIIIT